MRDDRTGDFGSGTAALKTLADAEGIAMSVTAASGPADAALWDRVKRRLRTELGEDVFQSWFARVEFEEADGVSVNLSVPTRFLKSWIQAHYFEKLLALWQVEASGVRRVELMVRGTTRARQVVRAEAPPRLRSRRPKRRCRRCCRRRL